MTKTTSRLVPLPPDQASLLNSLTNPSLFCARVARLTSAGWSLAAIANALEPRRPRSTVNAWRARGLSDEAALLADRRLLSDEELPLPASEPSVAVLAATSPVPARERAMHLGVPAGDRERIAALAPVASRYRAGTLPTSAPAVASVELDGIVSRLHARGVAVTALADAAGVTYRAMANRLAKAGAVRPPVPVFRDEAVS